MIDKDHISDFTKKKRLSYFKVVYAIVTSISLIYILRFNFEYSIHDYNTFLIPAWLLLATTPLISIRYSSSFLLSSALLCGLSTAILIYLLYTAGGLAAPGVFWLTAIPLGFGILMGIRATFVGNAIVVSSFLFFWYLHTNGLGPNIIAEYSDYEAEKLFNLVTFLIFASFTIHHFLNSEAKHHRRLLEKNTNVENLLRVLIHDIANTLTSMTFNLLKAKEDSENPPPSLEIEKIEKAVEDINSLLSQVRHLKAVKDGKASLPLHPISLTVVLADVYDQTEHLAQIKGIKFNLDISRDRMMINAEKTILSKVVLANLLKNAIKFSYPGQRIDLKAYCSQNSVILQIQDYGMGIPQHILENIFSVGYPTSRIGTQGEKGTGYGMPLVKEYLQMMGGEIEISTRTEAIEGAPVGTLITLRFPLALAAAEPEKVN